MKKYIVSIPVTGVIDFEVEAKNEQEAKENALKDASIDDIVEWDVHEKIIDRNVFYGLQNEIYIEEE